jgi:hypothetical protein
MTTGTRGSRREEIRQDRLVSAQIEREREAARTHARIAGRQAVAQLRREEALARSAARQQARERRAARRAARLAWAHAHVLDLLFLPVIVVPAVLAWTAMATYGYQLYGPAGLLLPAFSEGAMWAFAIDTTWTTRHHPDRPTWHLRLGTWVFAAVAAVLNFTHGVTAPPAGPGPHGAGVGLVMALVSVAGVLAHQLITAGPRQARIHRAAARRELAARRAAVRHAVAGLDGNGHARLIYEPGTLTLTRRHGRTRLLTRAARIEAQRAAVDVPPAGTLHGTQVTPAAGPAVTPEATLGLPAPASEAAPEATPGAAALHAVPEVTRERSRERPSAAPEKQQGPATPERLAEFYAAELAAGQVPSARRIKREWPVGYDRATELHDQLTAVTETAS